jgi:MerR family redox-sensitive transcriptional activator SoxR
VRELGIGDLARQARIRPSALRYYESVGLLPSTRRVGGRRVYPASTVRRIALIKMAQRAKFTLAEISQLLETAPDRGATRQWRALAERKIPELDQLIQETQASSSVCDTPTPRSLPPLGTSWPGTARGRRRSGAWCEKPRRRRG